MDDSPRRRLLKNGDRTNSEVVKSTHSSVSLLSTGTASLASVSCITTRIIMYCEAALSAGDGEETVVSAQDA